jgi:hypothetical protein
MMLRPPDRPTIRQHRRLPQLFLLGLGAAIIYVAALLRFPLLSIYALPIQNLDKLTRSSGPAGLLLASCVLLLFVGYASGALLLVRSVGAQPDGAPRRWLLPLVLIGFPLLFVGLLLLVYPTTSIDLYDYLFRGRMLVRYQANTFVLVPRDFNDDPFLRYVAWKRAVTAYGPLWEGMSWITARLAGEAPGLVSTAATRDTELLRLLLAYKGLATLGFLLCGAAIWLVLGRTAPEWRLAGLYLWLWNPLALWESIVAGHNDAWMALLIVLAIWAISGPSAVLSKRRADALADGREQARSRSAGQPVSRSIGAFLALTAGGLIKFLALFLGPVLLSAGLRRLDSWRERLRLVLLGGAACVAAIVVAYAPFWDGGNTFQNFGDRGTLFTASWLAMLEALLSRSLPTATAQAITASLGLGLLVLGVFWATWRAWHAPQDVAAHTLWLLLWFLFFCNPWFQPWYLLWALALVALQPWRSRAAWGVGLFCCTAMLSYIAGSFLLPALGWNAESAEWNALVSTLIYLPPLVLLGRGYRARGLALWQDMRQLQRTLVARRGARSSET